MTTTLTNSSKVNFNDTFSIGHMIQGTVGEVEVTKVNKKSFRFSGSVKRCEDGVMVGVSGVAKFWKESKDGEKLFFRSKSAVLTVLK